MSQGRLLLTGATGMVGMALTPRLIEEGYDVSVMLRPSSDRSALSGQNVRVVEADLAAELRKDYGATAFVEERLVDINTLAEACARSLAEQRRRAADPVQALLAGEGDHLVGDLFDVALIGSRFDLGTNGGYLLFTNLGHGCQGFTGRLQSACFKGKAHGIPLRRGADRGRSPTDSRTASCGSRPALTVTSPPGLCVQGYCDPVMLRCE